MCIVSSGLLDGNIDHLGECEPSGGSNLCFLHLRKIRNVVTLWPRRPQPGPVLYRYRFGLPSIGSLRSVREKSAISTANPILERLDRHPAATCSKERNENHFFSFFVTTDKGQWGWGSGKEAEQFPKHFRGVVTSPYVKMFARVK